MLLFATNVALVKSGTIPKTEGPWVFNRYVECLSGDPQYRDKEYYRDLTKYYLCDHCGSGFGDAVRETKVEHEHGW